MGKLRLEEQILADRDGRSKSRDKDRGKGVGFEC